MRHHVQVVRAGREVARVETQPKAAVGKLAAKGRGVGVAETKLRIGHRRVVQEELHPVDAAALDALIHVRARIERVANDQKVAIGMQLLIGRGRLDGHDQRAALMPAPPEAAGERVGVGLGATWAAPGGAETASAPSVSAVARRVMSAPPVAEAAQHMARRAGLVTSPGPRRACAPIA